MAGRIDNSRDGGVRPKPAKRFDLRVLVEGLDGRVSWQDLKDWARQAGDVTFTNVFQRDQKNFGVVEFKDEEGFNNALQILSTMPLSGVLVGVTKDNNPYQNDYSRANRAGGAMGTGDDRGRTNYTNSNKVQDRGHVDSRSDNGDARGQMDNRGRDHRERGREQEYRAGGADSRDRDFDQRAPVQIGAGRHVQEDNRDYERRDGFREGRDLREGRDRELRDPRDVRELRDPRDLRDPRYADRIPAPMLYGPPPGYYPMPMPFPMRGYEAFADPRRFSEDFRRGPPPHMLMPGMPPMGYYPNPNPRERSRSRSRSRDRADRDRDRDRPEQRVAFYPPGHAAAAVPGYRAYEAPGAGAGGAAAANGRNPRDEGRYREIRRP